MIYKQIIKLFSRDAAFKLMMHSAEFLSKLTLTRYIIRLSHRPKESLRKEVMGISFNGPIGLGPGLDKKGELYNVFTNYGFSFVDIGPMDAKNIRHAIDHIQEYPKDRDTTLSVCIEKDHTTVFSLAYDFMDMFIFDIPKNEIIPTMEQVLDIRMTYDANKPVLIHIGSDIMREELEKILDFCMLSGVDGVVVGTLENVQFVSEMTKKRLAIIGHGNIRTGESAKEMLSAGADLIVITTGLVMEGPAMVSKMLKYLESQSNVESASSSETLTSE